MVIVFHPKLKRFQASQHLFPNQILFINNWPQSFLVQSFDNIIDAYNDAQHFDTSLVGPLHLVCIRVRNDIFNCCPDTGRCLGHLDKDL